MSLRNPAEQLSLVLRKHHETRAVGSGQVTTPPSLPDLAQITSPDDPSLIHGVVEVLQGMQEKVDSRLTELATRQSSTPVAEFEFTLGILVSPLLSAATTAAEVATKVITPAHQRKLGLQKALGNVKLASYRQQFRKLDVEGRIFPAVNDQIGCLAEEQESLESELAQMIQDGAIRKITTPSGRIIYKSKFDSEDMDRMIMDKFSRLGELAELFSTNRVNQSVNRFTSTARENATYAKKRAYAHGASILAVVSAERDGEKAANGFFDQFINE